MRFIDLTGKRFGKWKVLGYAWTKRYPDGRNQHAKWRCRCDCGNVALVWGYRMRRGASTRCMECAAAEAAKRAKEVLSVRLPDGRTIAQIAAASGLRLDTVYHRFIRGWPAHRLGEVPQRRSA
jgi:hypothetical protein